MRVLDVGCGMRKEPEAIGVDFRPNTQADVIHDLDRYPYPFPDSEFDRVICRHIVEHLEQPLRFLEEIHRIAKPDALVEVVTPHFTNRASYADPTHRHHLSAAWLDYLLEQPKAFRPGLLGRILEVDYPVYDFYTQVRFKKVSMKLSFARPYRLLGVQWLANRFLNVYEFYFAFIFPARDLYYTLRVIK